ncbi:proline--tRNA ligase [Paenibacillus spongiae]|uniref:Proline--tRNA ligase n=1 Tax=Paenibacillus spongiae TaxID=2909671 RepID=A0ABY5SFD2_9BACL|nr:proline--tRNA ligase [Paenibacillus spongiae]UVI32692.1 proline--tRNA ligase [Paenibacillus spongiae]
MKQRQLFVPTLREVPAEAEAVSHRWMVKGGFIRQLASGVYTFLPLGRKVLRSIEAIIREEMERAGAQEVLMPALQPVELLQQSGRYDLYGQDLFRLNDRSGREFALGPTHEEVITSLIKQEITSYRKLPVTLYQIQTKFRDERRPRFGLLRGREFIMKDAYSFDADWEGLARNYDAMYEAYHRIFSRCGLNFRAVEADAGAIGGEGGTHEFMAFAESGEDIIVSCEACGYAANLEKAESAQATSGDMTNSIGRQAESYLKFHTPGWKTIEQLVESVGCSAGHIIKTLIYMADGQPVVVLIRGDHEANETKIKNLIGAEVIELADADTVLAVTGSPAGFSGPVGLTAPLLVDHHVDDMKEAITGANELDYHLKHVVPGRDFTAHLTGDLRNVQEGDACPHCGKGLTTARGIEIGHVFKLGNRYSGKQGASFVDSTGKEQNFVMGCYGIGVTRLMAAIIEQHQDEHGMIWPLSIAPYHVHIIVMAMQDDAQRETGQKLYDELRSAGIEALLDDRDERPGVKLKDADLIGLPLRVVVGKSIVEGLVELKARTGTVERVQAEQAGSIIRDRLAQLSGTGG